MRMHRYRRDLGPPTISTGARLVLLLAALAMLWGIA